MADSEQVSAATLVGELAMLDPRERREVATTLQGVSATFAEVPDGKKASYVLGFLAHLLNSE